MPLIWWGVVGVGGLFGWGYAADKTADATARMTNAAVAAGAVYLAVQMVKTK